MGFTDEDKEHCQEALHTVFKIAAYAYLTGLFAFFYMLAYYSTPMGLDLGRFYQWNFYHKDQNLSMYKCEQCIGGVYGPTNEAYTTYHHGYDSLYGDGNIIISFLFRELPVCTTSFGPMLAVVGFSAVYKEKFAFKVGLVMCLIALVISAINELGLINYKGGRLGYFLGLMRTVQNALTGVLMVVWAYSFKILPKGSKRGERCAYIWHVGSGNIISVVIGGLVFPRIIFPLFSNPNTPGIVRTIVAMFGTNVVFFVVLAFGRVSGYVVEKKPGHQAWGTIFFVTAVSAIFGRTLLTGVSGSTLLDGSSFGRRLGLWGLAMLVEASRIITRLLTPYQDKFFFLISRKYLGLKAEATFDGNQVAPAPTTEGADKATSPSPAPSPEPGGTTKKKVFGRGKTVSNIVRPNSLTVRLEKDDFIAESWAMVLYAELFAVVLCTTHVAVVEVMLVGLPAGTCITAFFITWFMQASCQLIGGTIVCFIMSRRTHFKSHVSIDNELRGVLKFYIYIVFTLGSWLLAQTSTVVVANMYRSFYHINGTLYATGSIVPNVLQPDINDRTLLPFFPPAY